jgi:hypothetical protein
MRAENQSRPLGAIDNYEWPPLYGVGMKMSSYCYCWKAPFTAAKSLLKLSESRSRPTCLNDHSDIHMYIMYSFSSPGLLSRNLTGVPYHICTPISTSESHDHWPLARCVHLTALKLGRHSWSQTLIISHCEGSWIYRKLGFLLICS